MNYKNSVTSHTSVTVIEAWICCRDIVRWRQCSLSITRHCHPVRQWKGSSVPVLLFCQNGETDCLMKPSKNSCYCVRTDIWSSSDW